MAPTRKLTGAQAALFAAVCHHYIEQAESDCNDTPDETPIFSQLSRAQRLKLVSDVAIGMLCKDEPLPPDTIQHNSAYRAIIEILFIALEVEMDMQWDYDEDEVGLDLLEYDKEETNNRAATKTEEELEERKVQMDLMEHRAEKNMKKLQKGKKVDEFHVEETVPDINSFEQMQPVLQQFQDIFGGGPFPKRERKNIRPLTEMEQHVFRWRRLCDAALQEDTPTRTDPFALRNVNFDWRCQKIGKWYKALNLLLDTKQGNIYGNPTNQALIYGEIDFRSYADPDQLPRIQAIKRNVDLLSKVYASSWDPKLLAIDERCIFATCSTELYGGFYHRKWVLAFYEECQRRGTNMKKPGNYQTRLNIFRDIKDDTMDGCEYPFGDSEMPNNNNEYLEGTHENWRPKEEGPSDFGFSGGRMCHGPGNMQVGAAGFCWETKNLQACAACKAVLCKCILCVHIFLLTAELFPRRATNDCSFVISGILSH